MPLFLLLAIACSVALPHVVFAPPRDEPPFAVEKVPQPPDVAYRGSMSTWNDALRLRPDFIVRLKVGLGRLYPDVAPEVQKGLWNAMAFDRSTVVALLWYQKNHHLAQTGIVDAETRVHIEDHLFGEAGFGMVLGEHLAPGEVLIEGVHDARDHRIEPVDAEVCARFRAIVENYGRKAEEAAGGGVFLDAPGAVNVLAIRGAWLDGGRVVRSDGPKHYHETVIEPLPVSLLPELRERYERYFFSGIPYASGRVPDPFDDVFLTAWRDARGQCFVQARPGSVDPSMIYTAELRDPGQEIYDGTAHLREGQYLYHLEMHTTHYLDHVAALVGYKFPRTEEGYAENPAAPLLRVSIKLRDPFTGNATHLGLDRYVMPRIRSGFTALRLSPREQRLLQEKLSSRSRARRSDRNPRDWAIVGLSYTALIPSRPIEVIRENLNTHNGILEREEIEASRRMAACTAIDKSSKGHPRIACLDKAGYDQLVRFRDIDASIHLNIHASGDERVFSTGCQTVPIAYYHDFLREVSASTSWIVPYMLMDSSRIAGEP